MFLFQSPPPTRFDLNFRIAGIPVRVHPLFWVIAILFSATSNSLAQIVIWIAAIFVSILIHELGHAFAMRRFGQSSHIILHMAGGLTVPESISWGGGYADVGMTANQHIFISLAGPFAGFSFAIAILAGAVALGGSIVPNFILGFIPFPIVLFSAGKEIIASIVMTLLWVNIFWGVINLMPVFPLDGGNVARYALLQADPLDGVRKSLWLSVIVGAVIALAGLFILHSTYMGLLFGLLAFQSYQAVQGHI